MVGQRSIINQATGAELKIILLDALAASALRAYQTFYQQYCNRSSTGKTYQDLYNDIHDLVKYEGDEIKSTTVKDSDMDIQLYLYVDVVHGTHEDKRSHTGGMKATVRGAPKRATEAATRTTPEGTNRSQLRRTTLPSSKSRPTPQPTLTYVIKSSHQASPAVNHQAPDKAPSQPPCKNCKSTKHTTKWCTSNKCFEPNCGKSFKDAAERKTH
jgi:hypothetical protein